MSHSKTAVLSILSVKNTLTISLPTQGFVVATLVSLRSLGVRGGLPEELWHGGEVLVLELPNVFVVTLNLFIEGFFLRKSPRIHSTARVTQ